MNKRRFRMWTIGCAAAVVFAAQSGSNAAGASEISSQEAVIERAWQEDDEDYRRDRDMGEATRTIPRYSFAHMEKIVEGGRRLAERLGAGGVDRMAPLVVELSGITGCIARLKETVADEEERCGVYLELRRLVRRMAFMNPVLDIDRLLFIKRHDSKGVFHMCDQFYGFNAVAGGGLHILVDPFGEAPAVADVLLDSRVVEGRLGGQRLDTGTFLSPELSYDGKTIFFAYSQSLGKDLEWTPESSYHVFRVNVDGSGLTQLTDGPWDDFDPCCLPNGRIAFISERCGGYLRCGRHCPTYTLFSMAGDGSDIRALSHHETHEWQPSVNHDGMLVYTRWDYVDRDTNIAHHLWTCYPDGRDPRSFHGNYPARRESRPWMEMDIRAIPGSRKYVAVAGAHHGHAFGSLVLIDPAVVDDGAMSQLTRLTPDVPFPEAERHLRPIEACMVYGTPWPLSEDDYLCVYGRGAKRRGIYWIDRFGNRELLYSDPAISCLSPMPLRARAMPPVIPEQVADRAECPATAAVMDVYNSDFGWPKDTRIVALRVIEVLPKTTPPPNEPRIGIAEQSNARAVLGTAPVESDGSAFFEAPAGREIYFQALDASGMAVQSMRSGTYLHPGERLMCAGCHESKHQTGLSGAIPMALRRKASVLEPGPEGSNPFNYVRLVQPVLDRHCVGCHREKGALDLSGAIEEPHGWTRSYQNLAEKYGFYFHVRNGSITDGVHGGSRSIAGSFGAKAAPLMPYLEQGHYGVRLPTEDRQRLVLWLDCNSEFFGSYEHTEAQSQGELVAPVLH